MSPITTEEKAKERAWEDYITKGNDFSNWFTAVIISIFVYLINIKGNESKTGLWFISFIATFPTFIFIFLFKSLGVWAASLRVEVSDFGLAEIIRDERDKKQKRIEEIRTALSQSFVALGILIVLFSAGVLIAQFNQGE